MTWATPLPILVFLGLSVLDLGPMYAIDRRQTDRQTDKTSDVRQKHRLMPQPVRGGDIIIEAAAAAVVVGALLLLLLLFLYGIFRLYSVYFQVPFLLGFRMHHPHRC